MRALAVCIAFGLGCTVMPPPPLVPMHADTSAAPRGATTAMLILGLYSQVLGGEGIGLAVRVEHQETTRTAIGLELAGGRGHGDDHGGSLRWLIAARTYGRFTPREHDFVALTYGGGLSVMNTGLLAMTLHGGGSISYPNGYFVPALSAGLAASIPILRGRRIGDERAEIDNTLARMPSLATPETPLVEPRGKYPKADLFPYIDLGIVVPIGDTGNRASIDFGFALALRSGTPVVSLSIGDAHRFDEE